MSEVIEEPQKPKVEQPSYDDMVKELATMKASIENMSQSKGRILDESKEYKSKFQALRKDQEDRERQELESKENWKELLEKEKTNRYEIEQKFKAQKRNSILREINYQVAKLAPDAEDMDILVNSIPLAEDMIDQETGNVSGLASIIDDLRKNKKFLFKQNVPSMSSGTPGYAEPKEKGFADLSIRDKAREVARDIFQGEQ